MEITVAISSTFYADPGHTTEKKLLYVAPLSNLAGGVTFRSNALTPPSSTEGLGFIDGNMDENFWSVLPFNEVCVRGEILPKDSAATPADVPLAFAGVAGASGAICHVLAVGADDFLYFGYWGFGRITNGVAVFRRVMSGGAVPVLLATDGPNMLMVWREAFSSGGGMRMKVFNTAATGYGTFAVATDTTLFTCSTHEDADNTTPFPAVGGLVFGMPNFTHAVACEGTHGPDGKYAGEFQALTGPATSLGGGNWELTSGRVSLANEGYWGHRVVMTLYSIAVTGANTYTLGETASEGPIMDIMGSMGTGSNTYGVADFGTNYPGFQFGEGAAPPAFWTNLRLADAVA